MYILLIFVAVVVVGGVFYSAVDGDESRNRIEREGDKRLSARCGVSVWNLVRGCYNRSKDALDVSGHLKIPHRGFANMGYLVNG